MGQHSSQHKKTDSWWSIDTAGARAHATSACQAAMQRMSGAQRAHRGGRRVVDEHGCHAVDADERRPVSVFPRPPPPRRCRQLRRHPCSSRGARSGRLLLCIVRPGTPFLTVLYTSYHYIAKEGPVLHIDQAIPAGGS